VANKIEALLWSIAFPGFGQYINRKFFKGTVFLILEFVVNVQANFNEIIISSFHGDIEKAIGQANYQWLMFYPCLYFYSMWDAWKDAEGENGKNDYLPFVFSAFFVTIGCIYSSSFRLFGFLLGPVWVPMLFLIPGLIVGLFIKKLMK